MDNINYTYYPLVLFTSFDEKEEVDELPFVLESEKVKAYFDKYKGVQELFGYIGAKNSVKGKNNCTYYYLDDNLFSRIEFDDFFRQRNFSRFFQDYHIESKYGVILFAGGGQYIFSLLGKDETKKLYSRDGKYVSTALFRKNAFVGFEEGVLIDNGIEVLPTGYYTGGMDIGGYLSFMLITLGYAGDKSYPLLNTTMKEKIFHLR